MYKILICLTSITSIILSHLEQDKKSSLTNKKSKNEIGNNQLLAHLGTTVKVISTHLAVKKKQMSSISKLYNKLFVKLLAGEKKLKNILSVPTKLQSEMGVTFKFSFHQIRIKIHSYRVDFHRRKKLIRHINLFTRLQVH